VNFESLCLQCHRPIIVAENLCHCFIFRPIQAVVGLSPVNSVLEFRGLQALEFDPINLRLSRACPDPQRGWNLPVLFTKQAVFASYWLSLSRLITPLLAMLLIAPSQAAELRIAHCLHGCPVGSNAENHLIIRPIYALSYNTQNKVADWAAYRVTADSIGIASSLSRAAIVDGYVEDTLSAADFDNAEEGGLARAQLVPLVNFAGTPYWNEVNYLSNAVARSRNLSQGAWYGLEWSIRNLVNRENEVYVLTGPIFKEAPTVSSLETQTPHRVPDAFFKIIVSDNDQATAFIFDQDLPVHVHHCDNRASIEEIERATGLQFFPENPRLVSGELDTSLGCF
jgi:endonuclease G, mitochondrial